MRFGRGAIAGLALLLAAIVLAASSLAAVAAPNLPAGYPNRFCQGTFVARGETWGFDGRNISCRWQRTWAADFVRHGTEPARWRCVDLGDSGRCHRRHTFSEPRHKWFEFYAED